MPDDANIRPARLLSQSSARAFFNTDRAFADAMAGIDARASAHEAAHGYSSKDWTPRGYDGLADSMTAAKVRAERLGEDR